MLWNSFGREHDLGALLGSFAHELRRLGDIGRHVVAVGGLEGGNNDFALAHHAGSCCVMQWNEPPPDMPEPSRPCEGRPMTLRVGNRA